MRIKAREHNETIQEIEWARREYGDYYIQENRHKWSLDTKELDRMKYQLSKMDKHFSNLRCFMLEDGAFNEGELFQYIQSSGMQICVEVDKSSDKK